MHNIRCYAHVRWKTLGRKRTSQHKIDANSSLQRWQNKAGEEKRRKKLSSATKHYSRFKTKLSIKRETKLCGWSIGFLDPRTNCPRLLIRGPSLKTQRGTTTANRIQLKRITVRTKNSGNDLLSKMEWRWHVLLDQHIERWLMRTKAQSGAKKSKGGGHPTAWQRR